MDKSFVLPTSTSTTEIPNKRRLSARSLIFSVLALGLLGLQTMTTFGIPLPKLPLPPLPCPHRHHGNLTGKQILDKYPLIDGHIDLPIYARMKYRLQTKDIKLEKSEEEGGVGGHVDISKLREGGVGGFFWSVYTDCPPNQAANSSLTNADLLIPTDRVRDTLEQIDVARQLIDLYPETFALALKSEDVKKSLKHGKIASLLGIEGGHQLGNSLASLRMFYELGVRYVTLTHGCHNAFADSCGYSYPFKGLNDGLSKFGHTLIKEMNRLGMIIDLSHTSPETASQALSLSKAPVIYSHSSARGVYDHPRNVPDSTLERLGRYSRFPVKKAEGGGEDKGGKYWGKGVEEVKDIPGGDAVVLVNFAPDFVGPDADVSLVADHVERIADIAGKDHVGLGSDFDGISTVPKGLEDVSKYPALVDELIKRGWDEKDIEGFARGNLVRVLEGVERVKHELKNEDVQTEIWSERSDL